MIVVFDEEEMFEQHLFTEAICRSQAELFIVTFASSKTVKGRVAMFLPFKWQDFHENRLYWCLACAAHDVVFKLFGPL